MRSKEKMMAASSEMVPVMLTPMDIEFTVNILKMDLKSIFTNLVRLPAFIQI